MKIKFLLNMLFFFLALVITLPSYAQDQSKDDISTYTEGPDCDCFNNQGISASVDGCTVDLLGLVVSTILCNSDLVTLESFWDFGDGNTAIGANTSHTYSASGTYNVCFTVRGTYINKKGQFVQCQERRCIPVTVECESCICTIGGNFSWEQDECDICFDPSIITNKCTDLVDIKWDLGDGNTTNTSDETFCHLYDTPGTYTVTMTACGMGILGDSCSCVHTQIVTVEPCCQCEIEANFTYSVDDCSYCFTPSAMTSECTDITSYSWDFDGTTSTEENPCVDLEDGIYNVCLTVNGTSSSNGQDCSDTICKEICVVGCEPSTPTPDCNCDMLTNVTIGADLDCSPSLFYAGFSTNICLTTVEYQWDFGNGDNDVTTTNFVLYEHAVAGTYNVCVTLIQVTPDGEECSLQDCAPFVAPDCNQSKTNNADLNDKTVRVFPNPTDGIVNFDLSNMSLSKDALLQVYSYEGTLLLEIKAISNQVNKIDLSKFSDGLYIYKLIDNKQEIMHKKLILTR